MKKWLLVSVMFLAFCSFSLHKFYVSINEIYFSNKNQRLEITSRIFVDDLDLALEKRFKQKIYLATSREHKDANAFLQKYFDEKFSVKVNGISKPHKLVLTETEENVFICYLVVKEVNQVQSIEIKNTVLMELYDQQHIFHTNISGQKKSVMLMVSNPSELLKY